MVALILVEMRRITDPDGTQRLGAVVDLDNVLSTPDIRKRLSSIEKSYESLLHQCNMLLAQIKTPQGKSNARLRWELANTVSLFLSAVSSQLGLVLGNYKEALSRDLGVSSSELRYILAFYGSHRSITDVDSRINWSKYREIMDISDEKARKECEMLVKTGKIRSDREIRAFKKKIPTH